MESSQFETLMLAILGLKVDLKAEFNSKIDALDHKLSARIDGLDEKLSGRIDGLAKDLRAVREQTATTVVDVAALKVSVAKIMQAHPELL